MIEMSSNALAWCPAVLSVHTPSLAIGDVVVAGRPVFKNEYKHK